MVRIINDLTNTIGLTDPRKTLDLINSKLSSTSVSTFALTLLDDLDAATMRATLGILGFNRISVATQSDVVADSDSDTLTLVAGTNITITTDAGTDTITIASSGGGGGGGGLTQPQAMAIQSLRI